MRIETTSRMISPRTFFTCSRPPWYQPSTRCLPTLKPPNKLRLTQSVLLLSTGLPLTTSLSLLSEPTIECMLRVPGSKILTHHLSSMLRYLPGSMDDASTAANQVTKAVTVPNLPTNLSLMPIFRRTRDGGRTIPRLMASLDVVLDVVVVVVVATALVEVVKHKEGMEVAMESLSASLPVMASPSNSMSMACMFWIRPSGRSSRRLKQLKSLLLCSPLLELVTQLLLPLLASLHLLLLLLLLLLQLLLQQLLLLMKGRQGSVRQ